MTRIRTAIFALPLVVLASLAPFAPAAPAHDADDASGYASFQDLSIPAPETPRWRGAPVTLVVPPGATQLRVDAAWLEALVKDVALLGHEYRVETSAEGHREYVVDGVLGGETLTFLPFELTPEGMFSQGSLDTVYLVERPMLIRLVEMQTVDVSDPTPWLREHGALVHLDITAADRSGQPILWNKEWLHSLGFALPWFLWDGMNTLDYVESAAHYRIEPAHFTSVTASSIDVEYSASTIVRVTWSATFSGACDASTRSGWVDFGPTTSYGTTTYATASGSSWYADWFGATPDGMDHFRITAYCEDLNGIPYQGSSSDKTMIGVGVKLVADDDYQTLYADWQTKINTAMEDASNYYYGTYAVDFYRIGYYTYTNSYAARAHVVTGTYLDGVQTGMGWPASDSDADLMALWTNLDLGGYRVDGTWDGSTLGAAETMTARGNNADFLGMEAHPTADSASWRRFLYQHESSHPFNAVDYTTEYAGCTVMDYTDGPGSADCSSGATGWDSPNFTTMNGNRLSVADRDDQHTAV